jgi:predicted permease
MHVDGLLVFGVSPQNQHSDAEVSQFYEAMLTRLRTVPGVESAALTENRIGSGWSNNNEVRVDGRVPAGEDGGFVRSNNVSADLFHVLAVPLVSGRDISQRDTASSQKVVVVNETFARKYLPGTNAVGHRIGGEKPEDQWVIAGVVKDSRYTRVSEEAMPMAWYPYNQMGGTGDMHVELRTKGDPNALLPTIRKVIREIDPNMPLQKPETQRAQFEESYASEALFSRLATFFGLLAALLVAIGLYGTLAYRVSRRTMEIGVRMALGAQRRSVLWMVFRESVWLAAFGIAIGLPLAWFSSRLLGSMLFGITTRDPLAFAAALLGVVLVAGASALIPARRAASVDPMQALRME